MTNGEDMDKKVELAGGLKNALERGENLEKAKQSFLNAGYKEEEIEAAAQEVSQPSAEAPSLPKPSSVPQPSKPGQKLPVSGKQAPLTPQPPAAAQPQKMSKKLMIILGVVVVLILAGAALLGLFLG